MKKIMAILSTAAILLAVTSCASTKAAEPAKDAAAATEEAAPAVQAVVKNPAPTADVVVLDNFEEGNYFSAATDTSTATGVDLSSDWASEGTSSLALEVGPNTKDSGKWAMYQCNAPAEVDWSTYKYLYFDVKNATSAPVKVCFCCMGGAWTWYQNPNEVEVGEEVINVKMSLEETMANGKMLYGSEDSMNMNSLIFAVDGATDGGYVYIDNVRLAND